MTMTDILGLLGGLALFLYGMQMMSTGLEAAAGNKMKEILEKLTSNRILGVLVGTVITAIIQSSSATTVMVVGFVNSGMMTLRQAVWIIMGANIGTTITGQLIAMDVGAIAPLLAFIGVAIIFFVKTGKAQHIGSILAGLGVLFIGMDMMSASMLPLRESQTFIDVVSNFENPIVGILAGTVFTAIIQSSSASIGILQALAASGIVDLGQSAYVLFGQNIGTCITAMLASIGTNRNAKRTTVIHISHNIIGTIIFTTLCLTSPLIQIFENWTPGNVPAQIANLHTMFNIITTLILLPVGGLLVNIAKFFLPDKKGDNDEPDTMRMLYIGPMHMENLGVSAVTQSGTKKEINRMLEMARDNVRDSFDVFSGKNVTLMKSIDNREDYIDFLNKEISKYITKAVAHEKTAKGSQIFNSYFTITSNVERIGDHAVNIAGYSKMIEEKRIKFSDTALTEIDSMQKTCDKLMELLLSAPSDIIVWHGKVAAMEQKIDDMTREYRNSMFDRLQKRICSDEGSVFFSEMLTDFERIGDHALNIADASVKITYSK